MFVKRLELEKYLKNLDYPIHSQVRLDIFQRLCFAYDKFFDDTNKGRLKNTKPKKGMFVKRKEKLELEDRTFHCSNCGLKIDKDFNAAINILTKSLYYDQTTHTVGLAGINGCGDGTSANGHGISSQGPPMNQQMLNLVKG